MKKLSFLAFALACVMVMPAAASADDGPGYLVAPTKPKPPVIKPLDDGPGY